MNTVELLNASDVLQLRDLARHYRCECSHHSKLELIRHIQVMLSHTQRITEQLTQLTTNQLRLLHSLVFDECYEYEFNELVVRVHYCFFDLAQPISPHDIICDFVQRGWIFMSKQKSSRPVYRVAHDWRAKVAKQLVLYCHRKIPNIGLEQTEYREEKQWLIDDLQLLLKFVGKDGLDLTQTGTIQKKHLRLFMQQSTSPESLQLQGLRFGYGRHFREYPDRFSLLYDFALSQNWLTEDDRQLFVTSEGEKVAHSLQAFELLALFRFWLKTYRRAIPNLAALIRLIIAVCEHWCEQTHLIESLKDFVRPFYYDAATDVLEKRVLPMLVSFGMLRVSEKTDHNNQEVTNDKKSLYYQSTENCCELLAVKAVVKQSRL